MDEEQLAIDEQFAIDKYRLASSKYKEESIKDFPPDAYRRRTSFKPNL